MVHQVAAHRPKWLDIDSERHKLEATAKDLTIQALQTWQDVNADEIGVSHLLRISVPSPDSLTDVFQVWIGK